VPDEREVIDFIGLRYGFGSPRTKEFAKDWENVPSFMA
jgi:hypothetical protein